MSPRIALIRLTLGLTAVLVVAPIAAVASTVIYTAPGTTVDTTLSYGELESPGTTVGGSTLLEHRDADYVGGSYGDWSVTVDADGDVDGYANEIWLRDATDTSETTTTVVSTAIGVALHGDDNDGTCDILVDGSLVAQLGMYTAGTEDAFVLVQGLPASTHTITVVDTDAANGDIAIMGGFALCGNPVINGDFESGAIDPFVFTFGCNPGQTCPTATVESVDGHSNAARLLRVDSFDGSHAVLTQALDLPVDLSAPVTLSLDVRIEDHNFGGYSSWDVYPANVRVFYDDMSGNPQTFQRKWYSYVASGSTPDAYPDAEQISFGVWESREFDLSSLPIDRITGISISSLGWSYDVAFDNLMLCATDLQPAGQQFERGDCNADGNFDIADAIRVLSYLFTVATIDCEDACDANDDGGLNIADAITMLSALFVPGSATIPSPSGACGEDPTSDMLGCSAFAPCP